MRSFPETVRELWDLLRRYAMQELYRPLRNLPAYVGWGLGGAALASVGGFLIALGALRFVQVEGPRWIDGTGDSSAVPYFMVFVVAVVVVAVLASRISKSFGSDEP